MNFSFGTPKTTGGFTLPTLTTTPATTNVGLNFASGDQKTLSSTQTGLKLPAFNSAPTTSVGFQLGAPTTASATTPLAFASGAIATTTSAPVLSTFSLGSALTQATSATGVTTASTNTPNLSAPATTTLAFNLGNTTVTTTSTGFSLGGITSTGLSIPTPATTAITTTPGFALSLGKTGTTPVLTTSAVTTTGLSLTTSTTAAITTTATTTTAATSAPGFNFAQLEEALNKWTLELEDQGKMFLNQALQLNAWDRLVIANGEKIATLNNGIEKVKQQQQQLDHELDFVLAQQRELEDCIAPLEKELKDVPITDQARYHTYQVAENIDTQLKQMSEDLKEIIEHLNESNKAEDSHDPVAQIGRILNAHMNSLQWIDGNTAQISTYLDQINKMHDIHRRDNERSFHLTYE